MSKKEWYTDLTRGSLPGKHVHVTFSNGTMDGCLSLNGEIPYWADEDDMESVQILELNEDKTWSLATGVESVSLVWDERDWEQIDVEDLVGSETGHNFAVVVNGKLHFVRWYRENDCCFELDDTSSVNMDDLTFGLRKKDLFPTESGFYRDNDNLLLLKTEDSWSLIHPNLRAIYHLNGQQVYNHLPLTPLHFVDGRLENE